VAVVEGRARVCLVERYRPEVNHEGWPFPARKVAREGGLELGDVDLFIFTQARKPSIALVMEELGVPLKRAPTVIEKWGQAGASACLGMALDDAREKGKVKPPET